MSATALLSRLEYFPVQADCIVWLSGLTESPLSGSDHLADLLKEGAAMEGDRASPRKAKRQARPAAGETETLNFKVTGEFKREFKGYAVGRGVTMVDLLKEGFELSKKKHRGGSGAA
jgi:hypothetical protein